MGPRKKTVPRKAPRQERAVASVDAILQATLRLIETHGIEKVTTAKVADAAGVSVGTVYQYFPSKEAIFGALLERQFRELSTLVESLFEASLTVPIEQAIRVIVSSVLEVQRTITPRQHALYFEARSPSGRTPEFRAYLRRCTELIAAWLERRRDEIRITDYSTAAFFIVHCAEGVAQALAYEQVDAKAVLDQCTDAVLRYLRAG